MLEDPAVSVALVDLDTVDFAQCADVILAIHHIPLVVIASPEVSVENEIYANMRICRKPIIPREVERVITELIDRAAIVCRPPPT